RARRHGWRRCERTRRRLPGSGDAVAYLAFFAVPALIASRSVFTRDSVTARSASSAVVLPKPWAVASPGSGLTVENVPSAHRVKVAFTVTPALDLSRLLSFPEIVKPVVAG